MAKKKKFKSLFALMGILFLGIGSWAIYSLLNQGAYDILEMLGVNNFYLQTSVVIFIILIFFILSGASFWKAINKLVKG